MPRLPSPNRRTVLAALAAAGCLLALTPDQVRAAEIRTGDSVTVALGEVINDDLYAFGSTVTVLGTVNGDVVAAAQTVTVSGRVNGSLFVAGRTVDVGGEVAGSVRIAGATVTVSGNTRRDLLAAGGTVTVTDLARIGQDVMAFGGKVTVAGRTGRNLAMGGGDLTLNGEVAGKLDATGDTLRLGDSARVGGSVAFTGAQAPTVAPGAVVRGETLYTHQVRNHEQRKDELRPVTSVLDWVRTFVGLSAFSLGWVYGLRGVTRRALAYLQTSPLASFGLGAAVIGGTPFLALFAGVFGLFVGGWWLGPLLLLWLVPLGLAGYAVSSLFVGGWVAEKLGRPALSPAWLVLVGVAVLTLAGSVPVLGFLVGAAAVLVGLGAICVALVHADGAAPMPAPGAV